MCIILSRYFVDALSLEKFSVADNHYSSCGLINSQTDCHGLWSDWYDSGED